jgi:hypothetical protein
MLLITVSSYPSSTAGLNALCWESCIAGTTLAASLQYPVSKVLAKTTARLIEYPAAHT